jgi:putative flippase GtrA
MNIGILKRLARSAGAGAVASMADLAVLTLLASGVGLGPRVASVPAFVAGAVIMFFGQKYFAFRERNPVRRQQVALFAAVQLVGLAINAVLYDLAMRIVPNTPAFYLAARMVTTNIVWLAYSFPVWHLVFRGPAADRPSL